jgi:hypothetical protein
MNCTSGVLSAWQHWHMPEQSVLEQLLPTLFHGIEGGVVSSAIRLALTWNSSTPSQRLAMGAESAAISISAALLGSVSAWLATPACIGYGFGKFAWKLADDDSNLWRNSQVASPFALASAIDSIFGYGGQSAIDDFKKYLVDYEEKSKFLAPRYLTSDYWGSRPPQVAHSLAKQANWGALPSELSRVFEKHPLKTQQ